MEPVEREVVARVAELFHASPLPEVSLEFVGADQQAWTVVHARVREGLSELYECSLVLTSPDVHASPDALVEGAATLTLGRGALRRHVHGVVTEVEDLGCTATDTYVRVLVQPTLFTLSQRRDSRIFQEKRVVEIVREVLQVAGVYQGRGGLEIPESLMSLAPREYCVQYQETDLDFVLRLLQEEGIPFCFRHEGEGGETFALLAEDPQWPDVPTMDGRPSIDVSDTRQATSATETLQWFDGRRAMRPTSMKIRDYNFTRPGATELDMTAGQPGRPGDRPIYEYPARASLHSYDDGGHVYPQHDSVRQARVRHDAQRVPAQTGRGRGNVTGLVPGAAFSVAGHRRGDLNAKFVVTRVEHRAQAWSDLPTDVRASQHLMGMLVDAGVQDHGRDQVAQRYVNQFEVIPATVPYRPLRVTPRPIVHGAQTAKVVGPAGEEIHVDFHGRVKVQFHWDRLGRDDEHSSCWIRTQQAWAGSGWGFVFIPRIGMEVVVSFLEGDPDRPLVTGCVYNGENHTPYELPGEKTKSTLKTNSTPTTGGYNEIRFEDGAGREQVFVQAERDHDTYVKNDQTLTVMRDRTKVINGRERNTIVQNRVTTVQSHELKEVFGNQDVEVHGPTGIHTHADSFSHLIADEGITLECGDSMIVLGPTQIDITSKTINIHGEKLVDARGGLVKINCDAAGGASGRQKSKREEAESLLEEMKGALDKVLAALPKAARSALRAALRGGLQGVMSALMSGKAPSLNNIAGGALSAVMGNARGAAEQALGAAFGGLAQQVAGSAPFLGDAVGAAQVVGGAAVGKSLTAMQAFLGRAGKTPAWQTLQADNPNAARAVMQGIARPVLKSELRAVMVPEGSGAAGVRLFDASAAATRHASRAAISAMF